MKVEFIDLGYDKRVGGRRWAVRLENGVEARIFKGDTARTYRVSVLGHRLRAGGLLAAQAAALEMLGVKDG